jgi:hypothetical protein
LVDAEALDEDRCRGSADLDLLRRDAWLAADPETLPSIRCADPDNDYLAASSTSL